jgi:hypothetical protein
MYRQMPLWYGKQLSQFGDVDDSSSVEVSRIPATGTSPPSLKLTQKVGASESAANIDKANLEFIRLSLPVKCNQYLTRSK